MPKKPTRKKRTTRKTKATVASAPKKTKEQKPVDPWEKIYSDKESWPSHIRYWANILAENLKEQRDKWEGEGTLSQSQKDYLEKKSQEIDRPPKILWNWKPSKYTSSTEPHIEVAKKKRKRNAEKKKPAKRTRGST